MRSGFLWFLLYQLLSFSFIELSCIVVANICYFGIEFADYGLGVNILVRARRKIDVRRVIPRVAHIDF
jgi:hypothetical protein